VDGDPDQKNGLRKTKKGCGPCPEAGLLFVGSLIRTKTINETSTMNETKKSIRTTALVRERSAFAQL